jgi:protein involved in polysaccharide export with SLBB domain
MHHNTSGLARACWISVAALTLGGPALAQAPGTFQAGDRVLLVVEGEKQLSDTFTVVGGPALQLPGLGDVSLAGVPRAEIEPYLVKTIGRFFLRPVIHARVLVSLSVVGEVNKPGFYSVPAGVSLTDAIMLAGGLTKEAKVSAVRIERDGHAVWSGRPLQQALEQGRTLDQLDLHGGERILVPRVASHGESVFRVLGLVATLPAAVLVITQVHWK